MNKKELPINQITCKVCGKTKHKPPSKIEASKNHYCSKECYWKARIGMKRPEHSEFMSRYYQNNKHPMLGQKHSKKTRRKMSQSWNYEKNITEERNKKISESKKGNANHNWKGGPKTAKAARNKLRKLREYKNWRTTVFERDDYTCQNCGARNGNGKYVYLEAHHIKSWAEFPELRFDVNNGITLCKNCHDLEPKRQEVHA